MSRKNGKGHQGAEAAAETVEMTLQELAEALGLDTPDAARLRATRNKWTVKAARQGTPARVLVPKNALKAKPAAKAEPVVVESSPAPAAAKAEAPAAKAEPVVVASSPAPVAKTEAPAVKPEPVVVASSPAPVAKAEAPAAKAEPVVVASSPAPVAKTEAPAVKPEPVVVASSPAPVAKAEAPTPAKTVVIRPDAPGGSLATKPAWLGINREGWMFIGIALVVGWLLSHLWGFLGTLSLLFAVWCAWFFRDPRRVVPTRPGLVVSPADGVVQTVEMAPPPAELGMGDTPRPVVRVFMNVFNVHVNRIPTDGTVARTAYRPGKFLDASLDKASEDNERMSVRLELADGRDIAFVQIAGLVARRIRCDLKEGQPVRIGQRFGLIRFGSRLDVYLPTNARPLVVVGQTMIAGESVLADLASTEAARVGIAR